MKKSCGLHMNITRRTSQDFKQQQHPCLEKHHWLHDHICRPNMCFPRTSFIFFLCMTYFLKGTQKSALCVGGGESEKKGREVACSPGLSGSFCSCAIICGGALRAALQHRTILHTSVEKNGHIKRRLQLSTLSPIIIKLAHLTLLSLERACPKKKVADFFSTGK